ncbi:hypothetical protein DH86_00002916 [Scytalidium sp. 3C]|nr:hypothetical protein DH86_00002916 [Scytalidium sp. 3C]
MNISQPVPSAIGRVDFAFLSAAEIKSLSVKKIQNPVTFDTLLHPVPGGLYDPALGAQGDTLLICMSWSCGPYRPTCSCIPSYLFRSGPSSSSIKMRLLSPSQNVKKRGESIYMQASIDTTWAPKCCRGN